MPTPTEPFRRRPLGSTEGAEHEKLKRLMDPIACDLPNIVVAWVGVKRADGTRQILRAVLDPFARQAIRGGLDCLAHRRIADIADEDLQRYRLDCRHRLVRSIAEHCRRLCPGDGPRPLRPAVTQTQQGPVSSPGCRGSVTAFPSKPVSGRGGRHRGEPPRHGSATRARFRLPLGRQDEDEEKPRCRPDPAPPRIVFVPYVWRIL